MPVSTHIESEANLIVHEGTGPVGLDDVREAVNARSAHEDFAREMNVLWDFGKARVGAIPVNAVRDFAEAVLHDRERESRQVDKIAVIAPEHLTNAMIHALLERTYRIWAEANANPFRVFRDRAEARAWLTGEDSP